MTFEYFIPTRPLFRINKLGEEEPDGYDGHYFEYTPSPSELNRALTDIIYSEYFKSLPEEETKKSLLYFICDTEFADISGTFDNELHQYFRNSAYEETNFERDV